MSVTAFRLTNFMAFEDSEWVELRKINLLYGRNSCGKSVLIRALRLLGQSLKAAESGEPITFVDEGGADVGSFKAALHRSPQAKPIKFHKAFANASSWSRVISFGFRCEIQLAVAQHRKELEWAELKDILSGPPEGTISFEINLSFSFDGERVIGVGLDLRRCETMDQKTQWLTLQFDPDIEPNWSGYSITHFPSKSSDVLASHFAIDYSNGFLPSLGFKEDDVSYIIDFERKQINEIIQVWDLCREEIANFLKSILYVGPIRPLPERYYLIDARMRQSLRRQGGEAFLKYLDSPELASLKERIERWMDKFDLAKSIRHKPDTSKETPDRQVVLRELVVSESDNLKENQDNRVEVNIKDIGFGASQILPVIIACLSVDENAFIIIEQPELHLHPEAQASAADLFIECVNDLTAQERNREIKEEKGRGEINENRFRERVHRRCLIETHSEHILLRLQLRIAGGKPRYFDSDDTDNEEKTNQSQKSFELAGRDFGLIFVLRNKKSGVSKIEYIDADPYGRLVGDMTEFSSFFDRAFLDSSVFSIASEKKAETAGMEAVKLDEAGY